MQEHQKKSFRITELDALRGLAAMAVVLYHYTTAHDHNRGVVLDFQPFRYGYLGVNLFFLISGFVILMTLDNTKDSRGFIISRFSRLFPVYWTSIILTVLFTSLVRPPFEKDLYSVGQVLMNFTMLQRFVNVRDIDVTYWTLSVELVFYFWMWVVFYFKKDKFLLPICLVWLIFSLSAPLYTKFHFQSYLNVFFILRYAPFFVAGILFYKAKKDGFSKNINYLLALSFICNIILLILLPISEPNTNRIAPAIAFALIYLIFYLLVTDRLKFVITPSLLFLGSISYPLYLLHQSFGVGIIYWISKVIDNKIVYVPITILLMVGLSYIVHKYIEVPAQKQIKNKLR